MNNSNSNAYEKAASVIIAFLCVCFSLALILLPKNDGSENENRRLAEFPELTAKEIFNSDFLSDMEGYLADHFPMRDSLVSVNTQFNELIGRREINQVFICGDGFLIDRYKKPLRTQAILKAFNRVPQADENRRVTLLIAPTASEIYKERLPRFAIQSDQMLTMSQLYDGFDGSTVDVSNTLRKHRNDYQLYYRTDHHWTTYGAYYAYVELCRNWELTPIPMENFEIKKVTDSFRGTTYSKVNDLSVKGEPIYCFSLPDQQLDVRYGTDENAKKGMLYNKEYLKRKDKYSFFLDNIHDIIIIQNPDAQTDRKLVVIKDSYANCFIPFLTAHFEEISVIDPRYYRHSIIDYINQKDNDTDVLILYNLGTMDQDTGAAVIF